MDKKINRIIGNRFTRDQKHQIIQEMFSKQCTRREIWQKYTGKVEDHGELLRWMRQLGYPTEIKARRANFTANYYTMSNRKKLEKSIASKDESFENLQLKKRILELEKQLKDAELKAIAFSTMVDIAEKEFKIPIRKKLNTKP